MRAPAEKRFLGAAVIAAVLLTLAPLAGAGDHDAGTSQELNLKRLERAVRSGREREQQIRQDADALARELRILKQRLAAAAQAAQNQESRLSGREKELQALVAGERRMREQLQARRGELSRLLGALARLSRQKPIAVIASPVSAVDGMRSSLLLSAAIPALRQRARVLQAKLSKLQQLQKSKKAARRDVAAARRKLAGERRRIATLLSETARKRQTLLDRADAESRRLDALNQSAKDLKELIGRIDDEKRRREQTQASAEKPERDAGRTSPEGDAAVSDAAKRRPPAGERQSAGERAYATLFNPAQPFSSARGKLALPARGRIVRRYGEAGKLGLVSKGISILTRKGAQVIAPYDGEVAYAGDFRGYGRLLIISHGEGYHSLLAGLSRIHVVVGQILLANEPVGEMGGNDGGTPTLYVELRQAGEAIDPTPWLAASIGKVNG